MPAPNQLPAVADQPAVETLRRTLTTAVYRLSRLELTVQEPTKTRHAREHP